jgi:hypothetical protein
MKRFCILLAGVLCAVSAVQAGDEAPAIVVRRDGRALRAFLQNLDAVALTVRLDKATANSQIKREDLQRVEFGHRSFDLTQLQGQYNKTDYAGVISVLEPVTTPYRGFVSVSNNLGAAFCLLLESYVAAGNTDQADRLAAVLATDPNPDVQSVALICRALSAVKRNDSASAETMLEKIKQPAARLYIKARAEQARNQPVAAIQTVVQLIAEYPNDMRWMPPAELLAAQLYLQMGMTNAALTTARQTMKFYAGMPAAVEAGTLYSTLEKSTAKPE